MNIRVHAGQGFTIRDGIPDGREKSSDVLLATVIASVCPLRRCPPASICSYTQVFSVAFRKSADKKTNF